MNEQDFLDIEAYLQGELSADRRAAFDERQRTDPAFAAALAQRRELNAHLRATAGEADFRRTLESVMERGEAKVVAMPRRRWARILAAAASVLLLLFAFNFFYSDQVDTLAFSDYPALTLVQRGEGASQAATASAAFNDARYQEAIPALEAYLNAQDTTAIDPQARLALGISLMETKRYPEAERVFSEIVSEQSGLSAYGTWYLALLSVRRGDNAAALRYLDQIPPGDAYLTTRAQRLRESL